MSRKILGIDEAGRGCVIGPMIIAGVLVEEEALAQLRALGVKGSKQLSPAQREELKAPILEVIQSYRLIKIAPSEIDEYLAGARMNVLEAKKTAEIIQNYSPDIVYIDLPGRGARSYSRLLKEIVDPGIRIIAENFADRKYEVVSAASILAKLRRDEIIRELHTKYGNFGSGYPLDEKTVAFLAKWYNEHGQFPEIVRKGWETVQKMIRPQQQKFDI